jgi:hypothetical protein
MSIKSKVFAATATLTLVGGAGAMGALTAGSASAATPSCGDNCVEFFSAEFGNSGSPNFVLDTLRQGEKAGQPQILFRTSDTDPAEDYTISDEGLVSDFATAGLVSPPVALHYGGLGCISGYDPTATPPTCTNPYPDLEAYEIEYSPYGVDSGLCTGVAAPATAGEKVTLQPCGVSSRTVWIIDSEDTDVNSNTPMINGSDTNFSQPFVLTYGASAYPTDFPRPGLYVTNLTGFQGANGLPTPGTVDDSQLWGEDTGVLG